MTNKESADYFDHVHLYVEFDLLIIFAVKSLSLSIIVFFLDNTQTRIKYMLYICSNSEASAKICNTVLTI